MKKVLTKTQFLSPVEKQDLVVKVRNQNQAAEVFLFEELDRLENRIKNLELGAETAVHELSSKLKWYDNEKPNIENL